MKRSLFLLMSGICALLLFCSPMLYAPDEKAATEVGDDQVIGSETEYFAVSEISAVDFVHCTGSELTFKSYDPVYKDATLCAVLNLDRESGHLDPGDFTINSSGIRVPYYLKHSGTDT